MLTNITDLDIDTLRTGFQHALHETNGKLDILIRQVYEATSHQEVWNSTVERTKGLDRIVSVAFSRGMAKAGIDLSFTDANGYDFIFNGIQKIEHKNATSDGNSWTGNKYGDGSKVDFFLLTRMMLTGTEVAGFFAAFVDLSKTGPNTKWVETASGKAAFSNLQIAIEDKDCVFPVYGSLVKRQNAKRWLFPELEKV